MAKKVKAVDNTDSENTVDALADVLKESINTALQKSNGKKQYAFFLDKEETQSDLNDWVSTGAFVLDLAISNRANGGLPYGRIIELTGLEASGKSYIASNILKNTQDGGNLAIYIDTENALHKDFLEAIGIDTSKMIYIPAETIEEIFECIETILAKLKESKSDKKITIVVDSIAGATTREEQADNFDKSGYATQKSIILSKAMRKITNTIGKDKVLLVFTNQLRVNMNAMFGADKYTTSGGKAIGFHASCRIRLSKLKKIKAGNGDIVGNRVKAEIVKNRFGPPYKVVEFDIMFNGKMNDLPSLLELAKTYGIVEQKGAYYTFINTDTGEQIKFTSANFDEKIKNTENYEYLKQTIAENYIMKYDEAQAVIGNMVEDLDNLKLEDLDDNNL